MDSKKGRNKPIKKQNEAKNNNKIVHGKKESKNKKKEDVKKSITEGGVQQKEIKEIKKEKGDISDDFEIISKDEAKR